jgi:hypothetical protein
MRLRALSFALLFWAAAGAVRAQASDPLKTPECAQALEQLQEARAANPRGAAVERLRHAAARTCLGTGDPPARPGRVVQAPLAIPPPRVELLPRAAAPAVPPPATAIGRPPVITSCDPAGCWMDNGGTHLQRVPPVLMAPGGLCSQAPGAAGCP